jgi:antitoxin HicB
VREWLQGLQKHERKIIGIDVMTVQYRWPLGMPLVRNLGSGLGKSAVHCQTESRARYFLCMKGKLFFFTDSSRKPEKLQRKTGHWLCREKMRTSKPVKTRNKHRGSSFREFLRDDGMLEEVQAVALKRAVALKVYDLMKKQKLSKSALAAEMRTSRAAIHRLLDPQNTSVTLATLNRAARSLGQKVKIELVAM